MLFKVFQISDSQNFALPRFSTKQTIVECNKKSNTNDHIKSIKGKNKLQNFLPNTCRRKMPPNLGRYLFVLFSQPQCRQSELNIGF